MKPNSCGKMNGRVLVALALVIVVSGTFVMLTSIVSPMVNAAASCAPPTLAVATPEVQSFAYGVTIIGKVLPGSPGASGTACSIISISISWGDGSSSKILFPHPSTFSASHTYKTSGTYVIIVHSLQSDGKISTSIAQASV